MGCDRIADIRQSGGGKRKTGYDVIGLRVAGVDYGEAVARIQAMARWDRPAMVAAANAHLAAAAYWRRGFGAVMARFDLVVPDGMPLVWCMNARGAALKDKVYGPILMTKVVAATPGPWKHFFFGGSEECLLALASSVRTINPDATVVGTLSPPYRDWTEDDQAAFARAISEHDPDFVWVALGGIKQESWIAANVHRFHRGVFLAVGDAFEVVAGRRSMAPARMQRLGLGWVFRFCQEPARLWKRYLVYNTMFVAALLLSAVGIRRSVLRQVGSGVAK